MDKEIVVDDCFQISRHLDYFCFGNCDNCLSFVKTDFHFSDSIAAFL